jgi:pimeloyl-ACP methyl ester carboxylesterase
MRAIFVHNAPTFLDELQDPKQLHLDEDALSHLELSVRLTQGSESPPTFAAVTDRLIELLPYARRETIAGAGHGPQFTHPERYVEVITRAARANAPATEGVR